jgi:hypothetical protein
MAKKAAPPAPEESPDDKPQGESLKERHYLQIRELTREVKGARTEWHDAKDEAAYRKKEYDRLNDKLLELISRGPEPQKMLPGFSEGADAWRGRPVSELGLPDSLNESMEAEGIKTLGDLQSFWNGGKYLSDIKGIGPEKSATVADAFADYGAAHPELFQEQIQPDANPIIDSDGKIVPLNELEDRIDKKLDEQADEGEAA